MSDEVLVILKTYKEFVPSAKWEAETKGQKEKWMDNEYRLVLEFYYWQSPMVQIYEAVEDAQFHKQLLVVAAFRRIGKKMTIL